MAQKKLSAVITIGGGVTGTLASALGSTQSKLKGIGTEIGKLTGQQKKLGEVMEKFGRGEVVMTGERAAAMLKLQNRYAAVTREIDQQRAAFNRLQTAQKRADKLSATGGRVAGVGAGMTAAGVIALAPVVIGGKEAVKYQTEQGRFTALGMGDAANSEVFKYAKTMKNAGTSMLDNMTLLRDATAALGDAHHAIQVAPILARMKFGNEAFYGGEHGGQNEKMFGDMLKVLELRGAFKSDEALKSQSNMVQQVVSATGGRVGPEQWRDLIARGGLAAQSMRDDAFFYQLEPLVQMMGSGDQVGTALSSAYQNLYQGRSTKAAIANMQGLGLLNPKAKLQQGKNGEFVFNKNELKGADLFRQSQYEWMKQVLLPALAKKGLTSEQQVEDAIGSIFSNRKGGQMFALMFKNMGLIDKDIARNKNAYNIDQVGNAADSTAAGKQLIAEKKLEDLKLQMGEKILPLYTSALELTNSALDKLNGFMDRHNTLGKAMVIGVAAIGAGLVVLGPIVSTAGGILAAYAGYQLLVARSANTATASITRTGMAAATSAGKMTRLLAAAGAMLGIANLGDAALGAMGVGGKNIDQAQDDLNWSKATTWEKIQSGLARGIEKTGDIIGLSNLSNQARSERITNETEYMRKQGRLPDVPPMASAVGGTVNDNSQATIHVYQMPGENQRELAERIKRELDKRAAVDSRSSMTDGVGAQ